MFLSPEKNRGKGTLDITFKCADRAAFLRPLNLLMPLFWSWLGRSPLCTRDCGNCTLLRRQKDPGTPFCFRNEESSHTVRKKKKKSGIFNSTFCSFVPALERHKGFSSLPLKSLKMQLLFSYSYKCAEDVAAQGYWAQSSSSVLKGGKA